MWTPPESAPPVNLDKAQSALPTVAIARVSAAHTPEPERRLAGLDHQAAVRLAHPGPAASPAPTGSPGRPPATAPVTKRKLSSACLIRAMKILRHFQKCSSL